MTLYDLTITTGICATGKSLFRDEMLSFYIWKWWLGFITGCKLLSFSISSSKRLLRCLCFFEITGLSGALSSEDFPLRLCNSYPSDSSFLLLGVVSYFNGLWSIEFLLGFCLVWITNAPLAIFLRLLEDWSSPSIEGSLLPFSPSLFFNTIGDFGSSYSF